MSEDFKLSPQQAAKLAQLSAGQISSASDIERIAIDLRLRQWCVEQANVFCENIFQQYGGERPPTMISLVATDIYMFVTTALKKEPAP